MLFERSKTEVVGFHSPFLRVGLQMPPEKTSHSRYAVTTVNIHQPLLDSCLCFSSHLISLPFSNNCFRLFLETFGLPFSVPTPLCVRKHSERNASLGPCVRVPLSTSLPALFIRGGGSVLPEASPLGALCLSPAFISTLPFTQPLAPMVAAFPPPVPFLPVLSQSLPSEAKTFPACVFLTLHFCYP